MLQLETLSRELIDGYEAAGDLPAAWESMAELESVVDHLLDRLRADRLAAAGRRGPLTRVRAQLDASLRTKTPEMLDRPDVDDRTKVGIVKVLHGMNRAAGTYRAFLRVLAPWLRGAARDRGRPARLLELASGAGEFTLALARAARERKLPVEVTGSDIVGAYVERGNTLARRRGLDVTFRTLNAFDMSDLKHGDYDVIFIGQTIHHFTPGQVAMMIAQSRRVASHAFVGVDGARSLTNLALLSTVAAGAGLVAGSPGFSHDAIISARRFYAAAELELIARVAAPRSTVTVRTVFPRHSVLTVS